MPIIIPDNDENVQKPNETTDSTIDTSAENDNNQIVTDNISDGVTTVENNDKDNYNYDYHSHYSHNMFCSTKINGKPRGK